MKISILSASVFAILLSLQPAFSGSEESCADVDIREINPKIKDHFSVPHQQGISGWCYAFVASDLLSAEIEKSVSAAHVAAIYNRSVENNFFFRKGYELVELLKKKDLSTREGRVGYENIYESGFTRKAIAETVKAGSVCSDDSVYSYKYVYLLNDIDELKTALTSKDLPHDDAFGSFLFILNRYKISLYDPEAAFNNLKANHVNLFVEELLREACKETINVGNFKVGTALKALSLRSRFMKKIDRVLEMGRPVGLEFRMSDVSINSGGHASVIIARRWKNERCEYKIRNSWGHSCGDYKKGIDCDVKEGAFWVDEKTLYDMSYSINYISHKDK